MKKTISIFRLAARLDRSGSTPLYQQIYQSIWQAIAAGELPPDSVLPSTRALARRLRVSRNTILSAYDALCSEELITARGGSGTRVRGKVSGQPRLRPLDLRSIRRQAHYPLEKSGLHDPDGNRLYIHR